MVSCSADHVRMSVQSIDLSRSGSTIPRSSTAYLVNDVECV